MTNIPVNPELFMAGLQVELQVESQVDAGSLPEQQDFERWVAAALQEQQGSSVEIVIRIVDEDESAHLNHSYRHKTGATNVLSFPFEAPAHIESNLLGDLVICAPVIIREASEQGKALIAHWAHMTVHGSLHLQGFDHLTEQQALEMERLETDILTGMGYAKPYADFD